MAQHDQGYKLLFSNPRMVEDLLRGFVDAPWVAQVDFARLEPVSGSYVSDDLREREDDAIWRAPLVGETQADWLYVYLLLEFQSQIDPFMAVRLLVYVGLLYQDLIKSGQVRGGQRLPPVLPLVLYNGEPRWSAPVDLAPLLAPVPPALALYQPRLRYLLIDAGTYTGADWAPPENLAAALVRLENSRSPEDLQAVLALLIQALTPAGLGELRRAFTTWLNRVLLPARFPGAEIPTLNDLLEVNAMLAERVKEWTKQWEAKGREAGRAEGRAEGRKDGEAAVLLRQIERKFGAVPDAVRQRIEQASAEELLELADRVLVVFSLEELLGRH